MSVLEHAYVELAATVRTYADAIEAVGMAQAAGERHDVREAILALSRQHRGAVSDWQTVEYACQRALDGIGQSMPYSDVVDLLALARSHIGGQ